MANRSILATATLILVSLTTIPRLSGRQAASGPARVDATASGGIRADHLTPGQGQIQRSIEQIAQAVDRSGRPLRPKLLSLCQTPRTSGHVTYPEVKNKHPTVLKGAEARPPIRLPS